MASMPFSEENLWLHFDDTPTINPDTGRRGWHGLTIPQAWPTMNLDPRSPGFTLKKTVNPPPPKPPISVVPIFGDPPASPLYRITMTAARRISTAFKFYHLDVNTLLLSLAKDIEEHPMRAYLAGKLGYLSPEALLRYVKSNQISWIDKIPARNLVDIVDKKIDEQVAKGHRRFIMTGFPDNLPHFSRFVSQVSDVETTLWFYVQGADISRDRHIGVSHFFARGKAICVQVGGKTSDEVFTDLMGMFYERTLLNWQGLPLIENRGGHNVKEKGGANGEIDEVMEDVVGGNVTPRAPIYIEEQKNHEAIEDVVGGDLTPKQ